jgi:hypothetical protein
MKKRLKVKVSVPKFENLTHKQQVFTEAVYEKLDKEGLTVITGLSEMDVTDRYQQIKRCQGVVVLAFAMWSAKRLSEKNMGERVVLASDLVQLHTTLALAAGCPLLVFMEKSITLRGILRPNFVPKPVRLPKELDPAFLNDLAPASRIASWLDKVRKHKHIFLGYCSSATETAAKIRSFLERLGLSVFDWTNFQPAGTLYTRIEEAAAQTACGIFLFTSDDETSDPAVRAPRDNVIFEAGYFSAAKGKQNTLIILEAGARVPTDLGGEIFIQLRDRNKIANVQADLRRCLEKIL